MHCSYNLDGDASDNDSDRETIAESDLDIGDFFDIRTDFATFTTALEGMYRRRPLQFDYQ